MDLDHGFLKKAAKRKKKKGKKNIMGEEKANCYYIIMREKH